MILGIDFDNTIVCYDRTFYRCALAKDLIPSSVPPAKNEIRNYLRENGKEDAWTELQGEVYGGRMHEADPFPGVTEFFQKCRRFSIPVFIVSHKTRYPYRGTQYDLHKSAYDWIQNHEFFNQGEQRVADTVFLELTKVEKIERIKMLKCTHFIDDLPEFLSEPAFPPEVHRILFDPHHQHGDAEGETHMSSWSELSSWFLSQIPD